MQTLVFDLDGTLSDPLLGISRSINYALEVLGYEPHVEADLSQYVGPPLDETFRTLTNAFDDDIRALVSAYRTRYAEIGFSENTIYPGISLALDALSKCGIQLGVCTSKRGDFAEKILRMFGIRDHFSFISGGDIGVKKGQQIAELLGSGTITPQSLMIGDRDVDLIAVHECGIAAVGVLWGYGSKQELAEQTPLRLLSAVSELPTLPEILTDTRLRLV